MKLVETSVCWRTHPSIGRRPAIFNQMIGVGKTTIAVHRADRRLARRPAQDRVPQALPRPHETPR